MMEQCTLNISHTKYPQVKSTSHKLICKTAEQTRKQVFMNTQQKQPQTTSESGNMKFRWEHNWISIFMKRSEKMSKE
jgi:hypothetical protein